MITFTHQWEHRVFALLAQGPINSHALRLDAKKAGKWTITQWIESGLVKMTMHKTGKGPPFRMLSLTEKGYDDWEALTNQRHRREMKIERITDCDGSYRGLMTH